MLDYASLDAYLKHGAKKKSLAGVSAVIMGPQGPAYSFQYGYRDAALSIPVDEETMFGIASMSKSITALCACILASEGRLDLDAPVCDFLPNFRLPGQPREAVTVRHLAMHTAGIPPMEPLEWSIAMNSPDRGESPWLNQMRSTAPNAMKTLDQVMDYIAQCGYAPVGAPGETMSYSNEGYALLSYVIDQAAGVPLESFMQERVFAPLGMGRSILDNGIDAARALSGGNITSLFERVDGVLTCDDAWSILPPFRGCAMVKSTARDMAVYYRALANMGMHEGKQVLPAQAVDLLIGRYHPLSARATMCMGLYKREKAGHVICEHSGALHGVSTKGGLLLGEGYGFAVLCNQGDEDMDELMWGMYNAVMGLPLEESHAWFLPAGREFSAPQMLRGRYVGHEGVPSVLGIHCQDGRMEGTLDGEPLRLVYCGGTRFLAESREGTGASRRLEFLIRNGRAWGVRCGTRVFERL
ncbi:MAG TPA: beta-lactamase family protein [Candidatus Ventricola intestinavium]|nr:beta-lactamase family protein [Candidatus Ventricola intestinavium]